MGTLASFEGLDEAIKKMPGKPIVQEALWDGDTDGWFLILSLYSTTRNFFKKEVYTEHLGIINLGNDLRIFNGAVPPWPEAVMAKQWGKMAEEKYGLTFYFPSEKEPGNNCPAWDKRHEGINCADCGKLIIPMDSPNLPKDICYHCHLTREQNERLQQDAVYKVAVYGTYVLKGSTENIYDRQFANYLHEHASHAMETGEVQAFVFSTTDLSAIKSDIHTKIISLVATYKKPEIIAERMRFYMLEEVEFAGVNYEFETNFNRDHAELSSLIDWYNQFNKAVAEGWEYTLYTTKNYTNRDDAFLRFIFFVCGGSCTQQQLVQKYAVILSAQQIEATLQKLQKLNCIVLQDDVISITKRGEYMF